MVKDNERFSALAREAILNFKESSKSAQGSLQVVADKAGTSYSTIRNILYKQTPISFKMAKNILTRLSPGMSTQELINLMGGDTARRLSKFYSHNLDTELVSEKHETYFRNESYFEILIRAFSEKGTSRDNIKDLFGLMGLEKLDELLTAGLLVDNGSSVLGNATKDINLSLETSKSMVKMALKRYRPHEPSDSWLTFHSQSYSKDNYQKIKDILRKSFKEIAAVEATNDGEYQGVICQVLIDLNKDLNKNNNKKTINTKRIYQ